MAKENLQGGFSFKREYKKREEGKSIDKKKEKGFFYLVGFLFYI